jgi:hypothetical protein
MKLANCYVLGAGSKSEITIGRFTSPKETIPCVQPPNRRVNSDRRELASLGRGPLRRYAAPAAGYAQRWAATAWRYHRYSPGGENNGR